MPRRVLGLVALVAALLTAAGSASAAAPAGLPGASISSAHVLPAAHYPGLEHLTYRVGPLHINPGQNVIQFALDQARPSVPGFITRFQPNLVYARSGKVPRVDVIHLHHGVWVINGYPTFAAGEEKTIWGAPVGYGYHTDPSDTWLLSYMIHNLTPTPTSVYLTYDIDFLPDTAPAAAGLTRIHPLWMDVAGVKAYPVFDALRGMGRHGRYTFPNQARGAARQDIGPAHQYRAPEDMTLVGTGGHLHPGGLWTDLKARRGDRTRELFRSRAKYFEPAGAVSWDVAMTVTNPNWRVAVRRGDLLKLSATYDTRKASWYEVMGIDVVWYADGIRPGAVDPFTQHLDRSGQITHGHLRENRNHGGEPGFGLPDARTLLDGPRAGTVDIRGYVYGRGDLSSTGWAGRPPTVAQGRRLQFVNLDATSSLRPEDSAYHTITACRAPCNRSTGIAYPIANARISFDSGELGYGPSYATPAANRNTWKTPKRLPPGTYTYFCRVHPFMRGSFRVVRRGTAKVHPKAVRAG